ncbi:hypothetical protein Vadar_028592 [Vaccinium darrowii]|uniref:Uncharacterized protein n=1 Tax=Vaccinium darrowii TaxID=229202 RepID=A0ACB7Z6V8_9ERIC|nr:hypothetical protein Vadar_028592 [Vaccinium darrowii]
MLRLLKQSNTVRSPVAAVIGGRNRWIRSKHTVVMSFGDGSQGALGLPTSAVGMGGDAYEPTPIPGLPSDVCSISAGHYHSLAVTRQGDVWAWGRNVEGQLGRGLLTPRESWNEPKKVEGLGQHLEMMALCGSGGSPSVDSLVLEKESSESVSPSKVEALAGEEIVKVSLGWGHALAQTKNRKLFGWGYSADGRLGQMGKPLEPSPLDSSSDLSKATQVSSSVIEAAEKLVLEGMEKEKDMPIIWEPCLIEELNDSEVVDVACGFDHSLVLCRDGTLLSGGSNVYGQLGRAIQDLGMLPIDIKFHPLSIASGLGHCLALCQIKRSEGTGESAGIVSWGWNQSSQLGREGPEKLPLVVDELAEETPISSLGRACTFCCLDI